MALTEFGVFCAFIVISSAQWSSNTGSSYPNQNQYGSQNQFGSSQGQYGQVAGGYNQGGIGNALGAGGGNSLEPFRVVYEWFKLDYNWPDEMTKSQALGNRRFIPENNAIAGIKYWQNRIFVTIPRWKEGVPVTLASLPANPSQPNSAPRLEAFPNWQMQEIGNCSALQFVQSMEIDTEGRMWIIDTGRINTLNTGAGSVPSRCPPKLVIIDLNSVQYPGGQFGGGQYPGSTYPGQPGLNNQPLGSNSGQNYPGQNPNQPFGSNQYPGQNPNQPYPGQNSQYPGQNSQYPGQNSQYPGQNPQYPGQNPQYPGQNTQYPGQTGSNQYPGQTGSNQYPGQTGSNQYPGQMGTNQYPGQTGSNAYPGSSQYPNNPNSQYPNNNNNNNQYGRSNQFGTNQYNPGGQYNNQYNNTPRYDQFGNPINQYPGQTGFNSGFPNQFGLGSNVRIVKSYNFPSNVATPFGNYLNDIVLDNSNGWYAYITDQGDDPGIVVYSFREDRSWKVKDARSMRSDPDIGFKSINNIDVELRGRNIDGIALSPSAGYERTLYFCPLGSMNLYSVPTTVLKNPNSNSDISSSVVDLGRKQSVTDGMIMDNRGNLYFGLLGTNAVGVWNTNHGRFSDSQRVLARDNRALQWPDTFAIDDSGSLWVVTNRLQNYLTGRVNLDEPNYRILKAQIGGRSYMSPLDPSGGGLGGAAGGRSPGGYNGLDQGYRNSFYSWNSGYISKPTGLILVISIASFFLTR